MKSFEEFIIKRKYKSEQEVNKIFYNDLLKNNNLFKKSIGKLSKELQEIFILLVYTDITSCGFSVPSTGNRIVQRKELWDELKKYIDGQELAEILKIINDKMVK